MIRRGIEVMTWTQDQLFTLRQRTPRKLGVMIVFVIQMLLMLAGDVEPNPGPGKGGDTERKE